MFETDELLNVFWDGVIFNCCDRN